MRSTDMTTAAQAFSAPSLDQLPIYAAVGVPEVWRYSTDRLVMYCLPEGTYTVVETSSVLPEVAREDIQHWIEISQQMPRATTLCPQRKRVDALLVWMPDIMLRSLCPHSTGLH